MPIHHYCVYVNKAITFESFDARQLHFNRKHTINYNTRQTDVVEYIPPPECRIKLPNRNIPSKMNVTSNVLNDNINYNTRQTGVDEYIPLPECSSKLPKRTIASKMKGMSDLLNHYN